MTRKALSLLVGHGEGDNLNQLHGPTYLFVDAQSTLYISEYNNHRVVKWTKGTKTGIVVAGGNGKGEDRTQWSSPTGVWVDEWGNVYVVDSLNHRVVCWEKENETRSSDRRWKRARKSIDSVIVFSRFVLRSSRSSVCR